jgi:uncharacterized protein YpmB
MNSTETKLIIGIAAIVITVCIICYLVYRESKKDLRKAKRKDFFS